MLTVGAEAGRILFSESAWGYELWIRSLTTSAWIDWPYLCSRTSLGTLPFLKPSSLALPLILLSFVWNLEL